MALTGLQIQKLLPKTNCKECGSNTCLAFAMKLAAKKADLAECPYVSEEARTILGAAAEPPVRTVAIGRGEGAVEIGGETVLFRHEKTFVHQTALGVALDDTLDDAEIERRVREVAQYGVERVGETLRLNLISLTCASGSEARFAAVLENVAALWDRGIVIRSDEPAILCLAARKLRDRRPVLASATLATVEELGAVAKETGAVLAVAADNLDDLAAMTEKLSQAGFRDILLELRAENLCERLLSNTVIRRGALKAGLKSLGYPTLNFIQTGHPIDDAVEASLEITKYGGAAILPVFDPATFVSLLTLRQNIYTDPQKPIQVEPNLYAIGEPDDTSPVFVTTNFSLTYFIVSGEIENAGCSAWLLVPECEGMSVLTAWAAGKFGGEKIGVFARETGLENRTKSRRIVIPGFVSQISGELEETMPGWEVLVGPQEAGDLESFIKNVL